MHPGLDIILRRFYPVFAKKCQFSASLQLPVISGFFFYPHYPHYPLSAVDKTVSALYGDSRPERVFSFKKSYAILRVQHFDRIRIRFRKQATIHGYDHIKERLPAGGDIFTEYIYRRLHAEANGEFVKGIHLPSAYHVQLSGFFQPGGNGGPPSVYRAGTFCGGLKYWARQGLLALELTDSRELVSVTVLLPGPKTAGGETPAASGRTEGQRSGSSAAALTPSRVSELKQNEEIVQLLYIAEQYLAKTLTASEVQKILFFYDGLGFSADSSSTLSNTA